MLSKSHQKMHSFTQSTGSWLSSIEYSTAIQSVSICRTLVISDYMSSSYSFFVTNWNKNICLFATKTLYFLSNTCFSFQTKISTKILDRNPRRILQIKISNKNIRQKSEMKTAHGNLNENSNKNLRQLFMWRADMTRNPIITAY